MSDRPAEVLTPYLRGYCAAQAADITLIGDLMHNMPTSPYPEHSNEVAAWFLGVCDSVRDRMYAPTTL